MSVTLYRVCNFRYSRCSNIHVSMQKMSAKEQENKTTSSSPKKTSEAVLRGAKKFQERWKKKLNESKSKSSGCGRLRPPRCKATKEGLLSNSSHKTVSSDINKDHHQSKKSRCENSTPRRGVSKGAENKGKNYRTHETRKLKEITKEEYFNRNFVTSSKPFRNAKSGLKFRRPDVQNYHLGSGVQLGKKPRNRPDRPYFEDSDEEEGRGVF